MVMKDFILSTVVLSCAVFALTGCSSPPELVPSSSQQESLVVFLVRHGERADSSEDSELSATGRERALALSRALRSAHVEHVHSSDFTRTRDTAEPTAMEFGLEVELYDPGDLAGLVERFRRSGGRHLVVGHSDTTPSAVELLGGEPNSPINADEFDRLYIVTIGSDGTTTSVMMRYGDYYNSEVENE